MHFSSLSPFLLCVRVCVCADTLQAALSGFRWTCQTELLQPYTDAYFDSLQAVFKEHEKEYAQAFCDSLFPALTDDPHYAHIVDRTKQLLASLGRTHRSFYLEY